MSGKEGGIHTFYLLPSPQTHSCRYHTYNSPVTPLSLVNRRPSPVKSSENTQYETERLSRYPSTLTPAPKRRAPGKGTRLLRDTPHTRTTPSGEKGHGGGSVPSPPGC